MHLGEGEVTYDFEQRFLVPHALVERRLLVDDRVGHAAGHVEEAGRAVVARGLQDGAVGAQGRRGDDVGERRNAGPLARIHDGLHDVVRRGDVLPLAVVVFLPVGVRAEVGEEGRLLQLLDRRRRAGTQRNRAVDGIRPVLVVDDVNECSAALEDGCVVRERLDREFDHLFDVRLELDLGEVWLLDDHRSARLGIHGLRRLTEEGAIRAERRNLDPARDARHLGHATYVRPPTLRIYCPVGVLPFVRTSGVLRASACGVHSSRLRCRFEEASERPRTRREMPVAIRRGRERRRGFDRPLLTPATRTAFSTVHAAHGPPLVRYNSKWTMRRRLTFIQSSPQVKNEAPNCHP